MDQPNDLTSSEEFFIKQGYTHEFSYQHGDEEGMAKYRELAEKLRSEKVKYKTTHVGNRCSVWVLKG